jgi:hypothetical protein
VAGDPSRATLIDKEKCSLSEDSRNRETASSGRDQVANQHVDVDEQVFSWEHGGTASADKGLRQSLVFRRCRFTLKATPGMANLKTDAPTTGQIFSVKAIFSI